MDNFYVTLISNNKSNSKNTPADFTTYLPQTFDLQGEWECGLVELSFQRSWYNIDSGNDETPGYKQTTFEISSFSNDFVPTTKLDVSPGYYDSIDDLLENFVMTYQKWAYEVEEHTLQFKEQAKQDLKDLGNGKEMKKVRAIIEDKIATFPKEDAFMMDKLQIQFDKNLKRVKLTMDTEIITSIVFSKHLAYILGFKKQFYGVPKDLIAEYPYNLTAGTNSLYIYTDIIQPTIVGDTMARLLRIVNGSGKYQEFVTKAFVRPYYVPLSHSSINSIKIEIKDEMNRLVRFAFGITIVKIHFQKKRRIPLL
jgi:hypothetical protein